MKLAGTTPARLQMPIQRRETPISKALTKGTDLESARLDVEEVPEAGTCRRCGEAVTLQGLPFVCAACGSPDLEITSGRELVIDSLEVRDGGAG